MNPASEAQTPQHSPLPWKVELRHDGVPFGVSSVGRRHDTDTVCLVPSVAERPSAAVDAHFIVRAVNNRQQMLAALKVAWEFMVSDRADSYYNPSDDDLLTVLTAIEEADRDEQGRPRSGRITVGSASPGTQQETVPVAYVPERIVRPASEVEREFALPPGSLTGNAELPTQSTPDDEQVREAITAALIGGNDLLVTSLVDDLSSSPMSPDVADALDRLADAHQEYSDNGPTLGNALRDAMDNSQKGTIQ